MDGLAAWGRKDGCDAMPVAIARLASNWTCSAFARCQAGDAVTWCLVEGGAHEWPAAAPVVISAFFRQHAK
jgi:poly(3-hydroxybutyrate) depolymerase